MNIDISFLKKLMIGASISRSIYGTLSGHAAGEPFDKLVYEKIKEKYPKCTFRQYKYLNYLYNKNPDKITVEDRCHLIEYPVLRFLLNRGKEATKNWRPDNLFEEKQNDTADIIIIKNNFFNIVDVKTQNLLLNGQPPNIISAYKLAQMCYIMLRNEDLYNHDITYVGIGWELENNILKCKEVSIKNLFKCNPRELYINWAAALQIQFHVKELDQSYKKNIKKWCLEYLKTFTSQAKLRMGKMEKKFIKPFI